MIDEPWNGPIGSSEFHQVSSCISTKSPIGGKASMTFCTRSRRRIAITSSRSLGPFIVPPRLSRLCVDMSSEASSCIGCGQTIRPSSGSREPIAEADS